MGVVKCIKCGTYIDESEAVLHPVDDTHDATYCVKCSPDELTYDPYENEDY